ncbi:MAG: HD-GYP domain-containing protein [Acidobacteriota bacterium]|nr:HD-GYP domain-containing protein [Acidobacteriota bacterium]
MPPDSRPAGTAAEDLPRRLAAALRASQLYTTGHPIIGRNAAAFGASLSSLLARQPQVTVGLVGDELVVQGAPVSRASETLGDLMKRLRAAGVERMTFDRGVSDEELSRFVDALAGLAATSGDETGRLAFPHIRVGRVAVDRPGQAADATGADTLRQLYGEAVSVAGAVWRQAAGGQAPDPAAVRAAIDGLARAVARNRSALVALTALKRYDDYTFTHMVNVSILTMAQARSLGIDGPLLREFGLAALMHDIGKVRTPTDILNKPDRLTPAEFGVMKRHVVDGAEILRETPEMPALAPVVAFEHHLRLDGTGYPDGIGRSALNLGTMLCSIADVYDAMRSQRKYQEAFPTDRILAVLQRNDGQQFDQRLVRRFTQLMGIYPPGTLVRLDTGEIGIVIQVRAADPRRPRVRILFAPDGTPAAPRECALWEAAEGGESPSAVVAPVDPAEYDVDPLAHL